MRIAVVGSGISGLGAAYLLSRAHDVLVFEQDARPGGHTLTVRRAGLGLDLGFLVHNEQNYPLLSRLFRELGVATQESEMSFSVGALVGSSTPVADRSHNANGRSTLGICACSGRSDVGSRPPTGRSTNWTASTGRSRGISTNAAFRDASGGISSSR